jgi:hypothetical protein
MKLKNVPLTKIGSKSGTLVTIELTRLKIKDELKQHVLAPLPGRDPLGVHSAAGNREAELGTAAIVVVTGVIGRDLLVLLGEDLDA